MAWNGTLFRSILIAEHRMAALTERLRDIRDGQGHIAVDRNLPGCRTRLGQLPEPVDVMALRGPPSAEIDGAGTLTVFFRIVLPLSVPALASLIVFQFLWIWNDLLVALIYVGGTENVAPMTVTLANLTNSLGQGYNLLTAAAFLSMIIPLVVFLSLQRYFVRGILAGSVKG